MPFGDLISYCLMPNHFHWEFFFVRNIQIERKVLRRSVDAVEMQRRREKYGSAALSIDVIGTRPAKDDSLVTLNEAIGIWRIQVSNATDFRVFSSADIG